MPEGSKSGAFDGVVPVPITLDRLADEFADPARPLGCRHERVARDAGVARVDPSAAGADAALFIGDVALRPELHPEAPFRFDLGQVWWEHTGLPFAFAVWQAGSGPEADLRRLHGVLLESRAYGERHRAELARRWAGHFGFAPEFLEGYWADLSYELDAPMIEGLRTFYALAAEIGEIPVAPALRWVE